MSAAVVTVLFCACGSPTTGTDGRTTVSDGSADRRADRGTDVTPPSRDAARESSTAGADSGVRCRLDSDCADIGATFCQKDSCDPSVVGTCALIPGTRETGFCQSEDDFVCGCDGKTYGYPCLAHAESVNIASQGPCPLPDGGGSCALNSDCGTGLYCKQASCGAALGTCTGEPDFEVCFDQAKDGGQAACGCDHRTYDSDCEAASYGISVDFEGACPPLPSGPCTSQSDCGDPSYAALVFCKPTTCGAGPGICTAIPAACPEIAFPVCGCNGQLYVNECFADWAGVGSYATDGGCP